MQQTLLPIFPSETAPINERLSFCKREGTVWYFHFSMPVFSHGEKDYSCFNMYTSQLVVTGQCKQVDIVKAFGVSAISVKRHVKKFREEGPKSFFKQKNSRRATVLTSEVLSRAQELLDKGNERKNVAEILGIKQDTLYRAITSGCLVESKKNLKAKVSVV